jgi:hypothetical protein
MCSRRLPNKFVVFVCEFFALMSIPFSSYPRARNSSVTAVRSRLLAHARTQLDLLASTPVVVCHHSPSFFLSLALLFCVSFRGCMWSDMIWFGMNVLYSGA